MNVRSYNLDSRARGVVVTKTPHSRRLRTVILSVFATFLVWQVVSQSFAAYFAAFAPETALWLQPRQPLALVNLADLTLNAPKNLNLRSPPDSSERQGSFSDNSSENLNGDSASKTLDLKRRTDEKSGSDPSRSEENTAQVAIPSQGDAIKVRAWAESALIHDPLNARALRILGQLAHAENNEADALKFMEAAAQLSLHDSATVYWLMLEAAKAKNYQAAITYADVLLRTVPELSKYVVPILAQVAEEKGLDRVLETVLQSNPPWRRQFFAALPRSVTDVRTPLDLLLGLKTGPTPPTSAEIRPYIYFLIDHDLYNLGYYTWLQFLSAEELYNAGLLFNGHFNIAPSGVPFDWMIRQGSGVTIEIVPKPESNGEHALMVDFGYGRVDYHSVTQLVMLAPGTYEFNGQYKGALVGPRGLKWRMVCADGAPVGESPMINGTTPNWRTVSFTFTVPAQDCLAQYVELALDARMASERFISGSILFDALQISRVP